MILTKGKESLLWQAARAVKYFIRNCTVQRRLWREDIERHVADSYSGDMPRTTNSEKEVIVMLDGKMQHGGISDRLRGIVSVYSICKEMGIRFRIHFVSPFPLEEFLEPSAVDWRIDPAEISYNSEDSLPIYCGTDYPLVDRPFQRKWLRDNFGKDVRQIHVYTNAFLVRGSAFRAHFDELFKMSPVLRQSIDRLRQEIEPKYIAITTRFQSLLGDFKEGNCQALGEADRLRLMQAAAVEVEKIHQRYGGGILLTSDSVTFLKYMKGLKPYVRIIEGDVVHMDYSTDSSQRLHLKTFSDLLMLSGAERVFLLKSPKMYNGGFPRMGAMIGNRPFRLVRFMY